MKIQRFLNFPLPKRFTLALLMAYFGLLSVPQAAHAQLAWTIYTDAGQSMRIDGKDEPRRDNSLIIYTPDYAKSTRTNAFGAEVTALQQAGQKPNTYKVHEVHNGAECSKNKQLPGCGNAVIPAKGVVLSAAGTRRKELTATLTPGKTFQVKPTWFDTKTVPLDMTNPNAENNPRGKTYPGFRASQQMLMYNTLYGQPRTGTNEFGFEVTVVNGVVVAQEGANSVIPENGFVLSGHGKSRSWLIANAPLGANVTLNPEKQEVQSVINLNSYLFQLDEEVKKLKCEASHSAICEKVNKTKSAAQVLADNNQPEGAMELIQSVFKEVEAPIWSTYNTSYGQFSKNEIKAVWHRPVEKTALEIGQTLDDLKKAGLNTVFLETYFHGMTIFPSQTFSQYGITPMQRPEFKQFDALKAWTDEAHKRGMQLHIWFQTFYAGNKQLQPLGPVLSKYPEWANIQYSALKETQPIPSTMEPGGYFLDPANPNVQKFLLTLIQEIVTTYPIDGFQLDYIRYPASFPPERFSYLKTTWGYTPYAREQFQKLYNVDPATLKPEMTDQWQLWQQYKVSQVSGFVQQASQLIRQKAPKVTISAAIFPGGPETLAQKHQDWSSWGNQGWLDMIVPMTLTGSVSVVENDTRNVINRTNRKIPVITGIFSPFNGLPAERLLEQISVAKNMGAKGIGIFDSAHLTSRTLKALSVASTPTDNNLVASQGNDGKPVSGKIATGLKKDPLPKDLKAPSTGNESTFSPQQKRGFFSRLFHRNAKSSVSQEKP